MEFSELQPKEAGALLFHAEYNALLAQVIVLTNALNQVGIQQEYVVPYDQINGESDAEGMIIGNNIFLIPANVDLTKLVICYVNGVKTQIQTSVVEDTKRITLPVAPLGDMTQEGSSVVSILFYPINN